MALPARTSASSSETERGVYQPLPTLLQNSGKLLSQTMRGFPGIGVLKYGWFVRENSIKLDDWRVPLFQQTTMILELEVIIRNYPKYDYPKRLKLWLKLPIRYKNWLTNPSNDSCNHHTSWLVGWTWRTWKILKPPIKAGQPKCEILASSSSIQNIWCLTIKNGDLTTKWGITWKWTCFTIKNCRL